MATLVLSTVGTMLGGPIGGAIGSLVGQSIDQQLFGSGPRHGPRLGDLSLQSSSYGTPIPKVYGTMRVAGSIVWATDLQESTATTGAKGQPDAVTYSYSVSFAVALSARQASSIGRIWADGKLLRGAAGDFKVSTTFRFYGGSEDQIIDPLIASIEGIDQTPAYRGCALAVFENLELADYGNRIPFLTFELIGDIEPPAIARILNDVSDGLIECAAELSVNGYAAYGTTISAAAEPFVENCGLEFFDDGSKLRSPAVGAPIEIDALDLGNSAHDGVPRIERSQAPARSLPRALTLSYYDPARDYQTGQMRATVGASDGPQVNDEIPVVLEAETAKSLVESSLARRWAKRDRLTLRLPPRFMALAPGSEVRLDASPSRWVVERCSLEEFVVGAELTPAWRPAGVLPADSGRASSALDDALTATTLALFDLPQLEIASETGPSLYVAAASSSARWTPVPLEISVGGVDMVDRSARSETVLGRSIGPLPKAQPHLLDLLNSLEIELVNPKHWLEACDDMALAQGSNLAAVGGEIIQFGEVEPLGGRRFLLSRLLRGRFGTEWAISLHAPGEAFALLKPGTLRKLEFRQAQCGSSIEVGPAGLADGESAPVSAVLNVEALRPRAPVWLKAQIVPDGSLQISWIRRSRASSSWVDEVDVPLGELRELYEVKISGSLAAIQRQTNSPTAYFSASEVSSLGAGAAEVSVQQIGDHAKSRSATLSIVLS
jgi:hypothetical protein